MVKGSTDITSFDEGKSITNGTSNEPQGNVGDPSTPVLNEEAERGTWDNKWEFLLSCLGYAVGFGNLWRFPFLAYKNGGAVFLIPYFIIIICAGLPLFFMELALGQYASLGPNILFENMAPILSGVGYSMLMISLLITIYYNMIFAWTLFYTFASFSSRLPWSHCENDFNSYFCFTEDDAKRCRDQDLVYFNRTCWEPQEYCETNGMNFINETFCTKDDGNASDLVNIESTIKKVSSAEDYFKNGMLGMTGTSWNDMGEMRWELVGCLAIAWAIIGLCMIKGVKSSGKVVYFTATFPYFVLLALLVRGLTLEGYYKGIEFYIMKPNLTRLMEIEVWNDAATQVFYSLGGSAGVLITLSSYNPYNNNCLRDAFTVVVLNSFTSIFAGFVIFSILGFMAHQLGVEIKDVVESGSGLAFIAYPEAVSRMPISQLWAALFFFMLITLGIDSQFSYMETLSTSLMDKYPWLRNHKPLVMCTQAFLLFLCGLTMCLQGGVYMFELFVWYSSGISLIGLGLIEMLVIQYVYGFDKLMKNIREEMGIKIPTLLYYYWAITWKFLTPAVLFIILILSIVWYVPAYYGNYIFPDNIQTLGWFMCASSLIMTPIGACWAICKYGWTKELFEPTEDMCPAHIRFEKKRRLAATYDTFKYTTAYDNVAYNADKTS